MNREKDREQLVQQTLRLTEQQQLIQQLKELTSAQIENVAKANPANIQEVAATQLAISNRYYESALQQSQRSFQSALIWASIGTLLIIAAVLFLIVRQPSTLSYVSLIGGTVVEAIAGLNFYLYGRASNQLTTFQTPLDRIGRFLIANSVCENLEGEIKNSTRAKLVETIATVPIIVSGKEKSEIGLAQHVLRPRGNTKTRTTRSR